MAAQLEATETTRRRLLADVAHELRTPLGTLDGFLQGLADGIRPATRETWDVMAAQTIRLRRLSDDISLVCDVEEHMLPLRLAAISLSDVVAGAASAARPAYDAKGVSLTSQLPNDLPDVAADEDRIAQVLDGLLANALRHTNPGGRVTVTGQQTAHAAHVIIADTGQGIAPEHLPHIFERFYRADPARDRAHGGSGIGLTIARALVAGHGGTDSRQRRRGHGRAVHHHPAGCHWPGQGRHPGLSAPESAVAELIPRTDILCARTRGKPVYGYAEHKEDYLKRLRRIEGQVRGLQRMVDEDKYCIDILTQVSAATKALQAVALGLLEDHLGSCVAEAIAVGDDSATTRITEASEAIARLVRS